MAQTRSNTKTFKLNRNVISDNQIDAFNKELQHLLTVNEPDIQSEPDPQMRLNKMKEILTTLIKTSLTNHIPQSIHHPARKPSR